jgi:hypothetical protein
MNLRLVLLLGCVAIIGGVLSSCHTPHAPHDLPVYPGGGPAIDNQDWSGTQGRAAYKERPGLNEDALHQMVTGKHHPYQGF